MPELWLAFGAGIVLWLVLLFVRIKRFLHILQLEEYLTREYLHWLSTHYARYLRPLHAWTALAVATVAVFVLLGKLEAIWAGIWALHALLSLSLYGMRQVKAKKPLVMTARARRLLIAGLGLSAVTVALAVGLGLLAGERVAVAAGIVALTVLTLFAGHVLLAANLLLWPLEERTRRRFQRMAEQKLRAVAPKVIAVTGSAGKTTTKELIAHLLSARYRVLRTPSSFNTPMGISRTVNDSLSDQDYFVVEMGAYQKGEIARLCRLVGGTDISVITTVNAQHLERFGSLEKTAEAKFEIVEGLKPGGLAVLNFDVPAVREHAARFPGLDILSFGVESQDVRLRATDVREQEGGIEVDVAIDGETATVRTPLLGRHNAGNVLAAIGVAVKCGLDLPYIAAALRQARPPEHRLQPQTLATGGVYLDDGYNGNPQGIIGALEVLGAYAPRRRIFITPGLIEMGKDRPQYHEAIGRAAAKQVDVAYLVGPKQTADIRDGMVAAGFPEADVHTVRSFEEARDGVTAAGGWDAGSVVLVANDLPDQFDEFLVI
jgi:UDP-N-acetylmuramoyl-tripeptide--D-alanyl-D-alanine ligase